MNLLAVIVCCVQSGGGRLVLHFPLLLLNLQPTVSSHTSGFLIFLHFLIVIQDSHLFPFGFHLHLFVHFFFLVIFEQSFPTTKRTKQLKRSRVNSKALIDNFMMVVLRFLTVCTVVSVTKSRFETL